MAQIELEEISKIFVVSERPEGRFSALRGAFARKKREVRALDSIGFSIGEGELVGYIGPNGAGKSTTVKVMSGILTPESGKCVIMGRVPWKQRAAHVAEIGVVFGQRSQLWWDVPVSDSFELLKNIYNVSKADYTKRLAEITEILDIGAFLKTPVRQLSLGQRMRCEIASSLLHYPKILFLDEPTIGLDAVSKLALRDFLGRINKNDGVTMILTTHDMDDIEALSRRVMVIGHGKLLFDGTLDGLKQKYSPARTIKAKTQERINQQVIADIDGESIISADGKELSIRFNPQETAAHIIIAKIAERIPLTDITIQETDTDEMIATMYKEFAI